MHLFKKNSKQSVDDEARLEDGLALAATLFPPGDADITITALGDAVL